MKRIERTLSSLTSTDPPPTLSREVTVSKAVDLMRERHSGCVVVLDGEQIEGIFTERDFLCRVAGERLNPEATAVGEVMTRSPDTLRATDTLTWAVNQMVVGGYRNIPIVDEDGRILSLLSMRDVVWHLAEVFAEVDRPSAEDTEPSGWVDEGGG